MSQDAAITPSIKESGDRSNSYYQYHVLLDESLILPNQSLSVLDSAAVRKISRDFGSLFERGGYRPEKDAAAQRALGTRRFDHFIIIT